ncbi:AraC family transcriptional regulator [Nocardia sp. NBC_00881]|uniref:helix-turn-helix transcriptional regulator n=1 Tax=Nocardia sp. NBC_00881 TaxID=2975995 RepID=UPI00386B47C7|nr:AraC family transcriptional regulator [Nocardia sp. NBC_00881]
MIEDLKLPDGLDGRAVRHIAGDVRVRAHRHAELEVNLVVRGTATYLLGERRYELSPGTLTWLFPAQDHILVNQSADHELWWAVFTPELVARIAMAPHTRPLAQDDPVEQFSRRLGAIHSRRLQTLFGEVCAAETRDHALANAGVAYLLTLAWRAFLDSDDVVDSDDVHPSIRTVARVLQADPNAGDLADLARIAGLSPTHLSRLFRAQIGIPLTRYRNQQRLHRFLLAYGNGEHTTALAAAVTAGFGSYAQFYRVFQHETGRTPSTLRANHEDLRLQH